VQVCRVPAYSPHAVAEHAVALLLALNRKLTRAHSRIQDGNFSLVGLVGNNLNGKTAGLIGLGKIGRALASILRGFGMRILAVDPALDPLQLAQDAALTGVRLTQLDHLLSESDVISLHAPLSPKTQHLLNRECFQRIKRGAYLINTSRGGLVDTHALLDALKSGQVGAAGLDVYEEESQYFFEDRSDGVISDDLLARLLSMNNVLITSHQGFLTNEALQNIAQTTLENLTAFANGSELPNRVGSH
jgi:D-lactate dehydrogenase